MSLTQIDPKCALIVVDLVKGLANYPTVHPFAGVVAKNVKLAEAFRAKGRQVVLVTVDSGAPGRTDENRPAFKAPPEFTAFVAELTPQPRDHVVTKHTWGAFQNTGLDDFLKSAGVTQVFVTGVATSIGVESTGRQAFEHGYNVVAVTDAMTDLDLQTHTHAVDKIFPKMSETATTSEVLGMLDA